MVNQLAAQTVANFLLYLALCCSAITVIQLKVQLFFKMHVGHDELKFLLGLS